MNHSPVRIFSFLFCLFAGALAAQAETTISSLPFTITSPGVYVLEKNLQANIGAGNAITINASNVVLDFRGHSITGMKENTSQFTNGIFSNEQNNIVIRNGLIRFFYAGITLNGGGNAPQASFGHRVENMRVSGCFFSGMLISNAAGSVVHNCQVNRIGGYTGSGGVGVGYQITGLELSGNGATVNNCEVADVTGFGGSTNIGILLGDDSFATNNRVSNCKYGIFSGKYQNNLTSRCEIPFIGGTDAGGNN
jgi:hypothetical protein